MELHVQERCGRVSVSTSKGAELRVWFEPRGGFRSSGGTWAGMGEFGE